MMYQSTFAIIHPESNDKNVNFIIDNLSTSKVMHLWSQKPARMLDLLKKEQIQNVIVWGDDFQFAQNFIIMASVEKIFCTTDFFLLTKKELSREEQIKWMTLGYLSFMTTPINAEQCKGLIQHSRFLKIA